MKTIITIDKIKIPVFIIPLSGNMSFLKSKYMKRAAILLSLFFLTFYNLHAQRAITGRVISSSSSESLANVTVAVKGSSIGTTTDAQGNFSLSVPQGSSTLVFTSIGFESQEVSLGGRSSIVVSLLTTSEAMAEVVVTGYGDRRRTTFTGSAVTVGADKIENKPFASVDQALQGNVAGLQLTASSGVPGSFQNIRIRGVSSISAGNQPLFVIDGVPVVSGTNQQESAYGNLGILSSLSNNDIESISVLKDASATALYGARGANGVIVITTKRGKLGAPVVALSLNTGKVENARKGPKMLDAFQFAELYYESRVNSGQASSIADAQLRFPLPWDGKNNTNWQDVATNNNAKTQGVDLSVRGGNERSRYFGSIGYLAQDGVNVGVGFKRTTGKLNYETQISDRLKFNSSILGSFVDQQGQYEAASWFGSPNAQGLYLKPIDPVYSADGTYNLKLNSSYYHPLYNAENTIRSRKQIRAFNASSLSFAIAKNLTFTSSMGLDFLITEELNYDDRKHGDGALVGGFSFMYNNRNFNWDWKNMIDYNWRINDDHKTAFKIVYEAQKNDFNGLATGGNNIAADGLFYPSSVGTVTYYSGFNTDWAINSVLGLMNYSFKNKFNLDATLRREGSSRFAPGRRWGTFYSIGGSYNLIEENFMSKASAWLNAARLRVSYGKTGNSAIGLNEYQAFLGYSGVYNNTAGIVPSQLGNEMLSWENNKTWNMGLDFGFFNRISGSVEYFRRHTYDLLLSVPLTQTSGFSSQSQNIGEMLNRGIEATVNADVFKGKAFRWNLGFNITSVKNEVTNLPKNTSGQEIGITTTWQTVTTGQPVNSWFMPTWAGVNPANGAPTWYKSGNSGEVTSVYAQAARALNGGSVPTLFGGINNNFEYKGVFFNSSFYYAGGHNIYDRFGIHLRSDGRFNFTLSNGYASLMNRWQKPGDIAENPKNVYLNPSNSQQISSRNLYKGDFIRLRDVTLGYKLPAKMLSKAGMSSANVYVRGNNLWTWTAADNLPFDPETRGDGVLSLIAQPQKTIVVGLNVNF
jgi:TonB-dependent starch-binding outer membrane protein SusC